MLENDIYVRYIGINEKSHYMIEYIEKMNHDDAFFAFNPDHIWIIRYFNNEWLKIDSIGGISKISNIQSYINSNIGFMVPHKPIKEFYYCLNIKNDPRLEFNISIIITILEYFLKKIKSRPLIKYIEDYCVYEETKYKSILESIKEELIKRFLD